MMVEDELVEVEGVKEEVKEEMKEEEMVVDWEDLLVEKKEEEK